MFDDVRAAFAGTGLSLGREELLDVLWLARKLPPGAAAPLARRLAALGSAEPAPLSEPAAETTTPEMQALHAAPSLQQVTPTTSRAASPPKLAKDGAPARSTSTSAPPAVWIPHAKALRDERAIGRSLRPVKRRVPVRGTGALDVDEVATADLQADTETDLLVLRPRSERWMRLVLVIDGGVSMLLWERHCAELAAIFERSGAFRQVETHQIRYGDQLGVGRPWTSTPATRSARSLVDPSGRTMLLVLSDGASAAWRDGRMRALVEQWAAAGPTAIVHMLPTSMWAGSAIDADVWHVRAPRAGAANTAWNVTHPVLPREIASFEGVPIPVVSLTAPGMSTWASAATETGWPTTVRLWEPRGAGGAEREVSARAFSRVASPAAVKLAAHLSAVAPLTVPVMQLVDSCALGGSNPAQLAEVFLSGLLKPVPTQAGWPADPRHRLFDFVPEDKDALLDALPTDEIADSSIRVGQYLEHLVGRSRLFPAWLAERHAWPDSGPGQRPEAASRSESVAESESGLEPGVTDSRPFARISPVLLRRFGPVTERPTLPAKQLGSRSDYRLRTVVSQQELVAGFSGFKKLTHERLPFISPGREHAADPENLFRRLASASTGVLLVGAPGTGKTRTGIEVGQRALDAGWRVLHTLPGESVSPDSDLAEAVLSDHSPVLVVIDYLNESLLDFANLRDRLLPEARRRDIPLALLASVRPGWLQSADRLMVRARFDQVTLRQDAEFQQLVTNRALMALAPMAIGQLGADRLSAICGRRPTIALLIAEEIERRVTADLPVPATGGLRTSHELSSWLERRLAEDGLTVPGRQDPFNLPQASVGLLAAAAAVAACPQPYDDVVAAARATLSEAASSAPRAEDVVATLVSLGWLEAGENNTLTVAHDVVADQIIESVMLPENPSVPDLRSTRAMLAGCLTSARTIGSFASNLGRLCHDLALAERADPVLAALDSWFTDNAAHISRILLDDRDEGGLALAAFCSGAPWSRSVIENWSQVVTPWLTRFGTGKNAYSLISLGLGNSLSKDGAAHLVGSAMAWLDEHRATTNARFVLTALLRRADLSQQTADQVVHHTIAWLDQHGSTPNAQFVLRPLLVRADLSPQTADRATHAAIAWLDQRHTTTGAQFVLNSLLARNDVPQQDTEQAVHLAIAWLGEHHTAPYAGSLLVSLMSRTDLSKGDEAQVRRYARAWLSRHQRTYAAKIIRDSL